MPGLSRDTHVLRELQLPARYEALSTRVGPEVAQILVDPGAQTKRTLERAGLSVKGRSEGALLPLVGGSGTGKTTLARNLSAFLPANFAATVVHEGPVDFTSLRAAAKAGAPIRGDHRLIPINIDHREATPPTAAELADIKRFIRDPEIGARCLLLWPQVSTDQAVAMSRAYVEVAGRSPVELPVFVEGPSRETWVNVALNTLRLSNPMVDSLELLGVDPRDYNPEAFETIGEFMRQIADDFVAYLQKLLEESRVPVKLVVVFVSESQNPGVLSQMTSSTRYGFVDATALLASTPGSRVGEWWGARRGALTQTIVRLDAHAVYLSPTTSIPILRRHGGEDVQALLNDLGIQRSGPADVSQTVRRSDLGQLLLGIERSTFEARGTPSTQAVPAFQQLADRGFNLGKDKGHNTSMSEAITAFMKAEEIESEAVVPEKGFLNGALIPDNAVPFANEILCVEYTWRKGEFLASKSRATVAEYILRKLKDYAVALEWVDP
jgi:energy-coupling factor transporter ATP-binding protein EcfA2